MSNFLEAIAITTAVEEIAPATLLRDEHKEKVARFVRGPIPAAWLEQAARLPGKTLYAAMALRYLDGFQGMGVVRMRPSVRDAYGMDRFSCARALNQMEQAGLVKVSRRTGAAPVVTILAAST